MASSFVVPVFATEAEEADWWYANRDLVEHQFLKAAEEGRLRRSTLVQRAQQVQAQRETGDLVRLNETDTNRARAAAERRGMPYKAFVRMLVHQALERDEADSGS